MKKLRSLFKRIVEAFKEPKQIAPEVTQDYAPKSMNITYEALAYMRTKDGENVQAFKIPEPFPGVVPAGAPTMAMDSNISAAYGFAQISAAYAEGVQFMGYQYLSELTQRAEYRRPSEIIAKEMTRKWLKLQAVGEEDKSEKIKAIEDELTRLNAQSILRKAAEMDGYYGRCQIYLDIGVDLEDRDELQSPMALTSAKVPLNSLKSLKIIEPMWTYPNRYNSNDPLDPTFYKPQSWFVMGKEIHSSRLLTIVSRPMPDILKAAYAFGGLSLSQMMKPYVDNWLRTRQSVSDLVHSFSVSGLATDLGSILSGGLGQQLAQRVQLFNHGRDNRGMMVIDKNSEEFFNVTTPLSGLEGLQAQSQEQMSSVCGIPLSILLGITPSGLNASNDGEIRTFYQWVEAQQEATLTPHVEYLLKTIQLSLFGEIDPGIHFMWEPLWSMSDKELSEIRKVDAETDVAYLEAGVVSAQEVRTRIAGDENSPYSSLDLDVDAVPEPPQDDESDMSQGFPSMNLADNPKKELNDKPDESARV